MTSPNSSEPKPTLFGISNSNRIPADFWGKNRFNSSFPAALACWMRHKGLNPVYVHTSEGNIIASDEKISFDDVFNSKAPNEELRFDFESRFAEFQNYSHDSLEAIDLVISEGDDIRRALEVKLTVLPDQTTFTKSEELWGCELVVRPVSVIYAALTIFHSLSDKKSEALSLIQKTALDIGDWTNSSEIASNRNEILNTLDKFLDTFSDNQVPLILQPRLEDERKTPRSRRSGVRRFRLEQHGYLSHVPQLSRFPKKFGKVVRRSVGSCRSLLLCSRICECNPQPADLTFPSTNGPRRTAEYFPKCQT